MSAIYPYATLAGRLLLCSIFLMSGLGKIFDWSSAAASMEKKGMVAVPLFLSGAVAFEIVGGLLILVGYRVRFGALLLILFLIPTTLLFHNFWVYEGSERFGQMNQFMKNLAIMGGLLVLVAHGAGRLSVDLCLGARENRRTKLREKKQPMMVG